MRRLKDLMQICQGMEVYVVHEVLINDFEKDKDHACHLKDDSQQGFVNGDGQLNIFEYEERDEK